MTNEKKKGGAGKFFLGALFGGIAGAVAGKFIKDKMDTAECECDECLGECDECCCGDFDKEVATKKSDDKKTEKAGEKKTSEKK